MDAATILTLKLVRSAGSRSYKGREHCGTEPASQSPVDMWKRIEHVLVIRVLLTTVDLVAAILAVRISITSPLLVDTLAGATLDLAGWALGVYRWLAATLLQGLIRLV